MRDIKNITTDEIKEICKIIGEDKNYGCLKDNINVWQDIIFLCFFTVDYCFPKKIKNKIYAYLKKVDINIGDWYIAKGICENEII